MLSKENQIKNNRMGIDTDRGTYTVPYIKFLDPEVQSF